MTIKTIFCLVLAITVLTSCSSTDLATNNMQANSIVINTQTTEPNKIRFSGKGAGAGMMLMSSMGAMGVAIGVAIDEGIGNDINKTAQSGNFNIEDIILQKLSSTLKKQAN